MLLFTNEKDTANMNGLKYCTWTVSDERLGESELELKSDVTLKNSERYFCQILSRIQII